ncbi:ABC transporter permease subunit [Pseudobacter ginsenosidimutans]|uniref:ABC-2 type transport system permease protein n=1 Tax=Pseudobacter ginsenosidimutans TaxID=661488 RepID=A0A4Q7N3F2_9BACT|nr:Gldg family protein [Pseudobacter ginsenosidimutans]QEC43630.1 ABC transporter permease subunit [Pseudobacter ginsenosidimutans]RZS75028.1 ABC-2 type transport system permease protein [Pseudobacter ginsenosidimutans]
MTIILKIARAELRSLFYSPVAWIIIVVFFTVSAAFFAGQLMDVSRVQQLKLENEQGWTGFQGALSLNLFTNTIRQVLQYFFMFIPLLTMGSISRELSSGTMKLLSASPVRIREIILGKFTGLVLFGLVLLSAIAMLLFTGYFSIQDAEFAWYLSVLLGLFLLSATYMAIGLFLSSITSYQIVAALATFMTFVLLNMVGNIGQQYDLIRDITWFLSITGRTEQMLEGLITTRDVLYFVLIIALFLGLSMLAMKRRQESKSWLSFLHLNLGLIVIVLTLGYFSSRPAYTGYWDVTRNELNTIDTATRNILKELDGSPVTVTLYTNLLGEGTQAGLPVSRNAYMSGMWDRYIRFYPNIDFKYQYYYDIKKEDSSFLQSYPGKNIHQIAAQMARLYKVDTQDFKKPGEIDQLADFSEEPYRLIMELEYKGEKSFLRINGGSWPAEPNLSASVRRLLKDNMPKVLFTTGHYERSPWRNGEREYGKHTNLKMVESAMINIGMEADTISLRSNEIPEQTAILAIPDPKSVLEADEQKKILAYLEKGGNAIFYAEPGKQQLLNPLLQYLGVHIDKGILVKPGLHRSPALFDAYLNKTGNYMAREAYMQVFQQTGQNPAGAFFTGVNNISYRDTNGFKVEPIITLPGNDNIWIENGLFVADSAAPVFAFEEGDNRKEEYVLGVRLSRKLNHKEQRIVVVADADFMSAANNSGHSIGLGLYSWLVYNRYPVYTSVKQARDTRLTIGAGTGKAIWYLYVYILPGLLLLAGILIIVRRKRK